MRTLEQIYYDIDKEEEMNVREYIKNYKFYDGIKRAKKLSASQLSRDVLELYNDATEEPKKGTFSKAEIGSVFHLGMESVFKSHPSVVDGAWVQEKRFSKDIGDYTIDGKMDMIDFMNHIIYDWKGMSAYAYSLFSKTNKMEKINIQMAIYNWLLGGGFTAEAHVFITDWDPVKPSHPASAYQIVKCNIMTVDEVEAYMIVKTAELSSWLDKKKTPPKCEDTMYRFVKEGVYIEAKCAYYCNYAHVCKRKQDDTAKKLGLEWGK